MQRCRDVVGFLENTPASRAFSRDFIRLDQNFICLGLKAPYFHPSIRNATTSTTLLHRPLFIVYNNIKIIYIVRLLHPTTSTTKTTSCSRLVGLCRTTIFRNLLHYLYKVFCILDIQETNTEIGIGNKIFYIENMVNVVSKAENLMGYGFFGVPIDRVILVKVNPKLNNFKQF